MKKQKKLVVFYSFEGNNRLISKAISKEVKADLLELKPVKEIKTRGFMKYFWGGKQVLMKEKPALKPLSKDPQKYDLIFIGTPVWALTFSPPLRSFFSKVKLKNKKIALFCCHEGHKGKTLEKMESELKGNKIVGKTDFIYPLEDKLNNKRKAVSWAKSLDKK